MIPSIRRDFPEHRFQKSVYEFLEASLPKPEAWMTSIDHSGGGRLQAAIKQGRGVKAGLADVWIVYRGKLHCIELKAPKGTVAEAQKHIARQLHAAGVPTLRATTLDHIVQCCECWGIPLRARLTEPAQVAAARTTA